MKLARSVTVAVHQGPTYFAQNTTHEGPVFANYYDRIEVRFNEYPDHTESSVRMFRGDECLRELWDCPLDIEYLPDEKPEEEK